MTRITVDVNEEWLDAAKEALGTDTKVATINEALRTFAVRRQAAEAIAVFRNAEMDFSGSEESWGYGGGRDLSRLAEDARGERAA
ncbi:type II toxin-antitoxin system VapB family antitoxin [Catenuloplanes sp. NPDC051500]|uniref:type II toxin-antitoxin system VapB family antitoxin n=1 Tax=Catenuloplanes sp. NPDC051500 TaxID=3363959 RepID=UPI00379E6CEF